jgi:hypothetical protein
MESGQSRLNRRQRRDGMVARWCGGPGRGLMMTPPAGKTGTAARSADQLEGDPPEKVANPITNDYI